MDVVIIGGGHAGQIVGQSCSKAGLEVAIIEAAGRKPENWAGEWFEGRGVVSNRRLVAVLDPETGDERRLIPTTAIVLAVGQLDSENLVNRTLGVTKLGVQISTDGKSFVCNQRGETQADGIFATGSCASEPTQFISEAIISYCSKSMAER